MPSTGVSSSSAAAPDVPHLGGDVHLLLAREHRRFVGRHGQPLVQGFEASPDILQLFDDLPQLGLRGGLGFGHGSSLRLDASVPSSNRIRSA